jgi:ubiquitin-like modifier-activating enzyme ATG7
VYDKLCINAALGFDSYMVMHHGRRLHTAPSSSHGCYFCSDIVAAGNSQRDRTLDEQCTVTRPGLSFIAAALCAELLVALLHRDPRAARRADGGDDSDHGGHNDDEDSGAIPPHQIRGNVLGFTQMNLEVRDTPRTLDARSWLPHILWCFHALLCCCVVSGVSLLHRLFRSRSGQLP